jgi:hypothetical protein
MSISAGIISLLATLGPAIQALQPPPSPGPFGIGEELVYQLRAARFGRVGTGTMRVEGPDSIRGRPTYRLHFDIKGRVGPFNIEDCTRSWLDPTGPSALRYEKRERHPLSTRVEEVELFPAESRWQATDGASGETLTEHPLDELSFIYLLRTLDLEDGAEFSLDRHYQAERNPVLVRVLGRERVALPSGVFSTILVEMRVRDGRRFNGSGLILLHLTDDAQRYPVRIETAMPVVGKMVLELEALTPASGPPLQEGGLVPGEAPPNAEIES